MFSPGSNVRDEQVNQATLLLPSDDGPPLFECHLCPEEFLLESNLKQHLHDHASHQPHHLDAQVALQTVRKWPQGRSTFQLNAHGSALLTGLAS